MRQDEQNFDVLLLLDMPNKNNFHNGGSVHVIPTQTKIKSTKISNSKKSAHNKEESTNDVLTKILRDIKANYDTVMLEENSNATCIPLSLNATTHIPEDKSKREDDSLEDRKRKFTQMSSSVPSGNVKVQHEINMENKKFKGSIRPQIATQRTIANYFKKF